MPITRIVAWDERLKSFKGRDATQYVITSAELAKTCGACREPLTPGDHLSLLVHITQSSAPDGSEYLTFTDVVCHRRCSDPVVTVEQTEWQPDTLAPVAARVVLEQRSGTGQSRVVPALAYTLVPVLTFREKGGDLTSALVASLLSEGFQLAMSANYSDLLDQARDACPGCRFTINTQGVLQLNMSGQVLYREQLQPQSHNDVEWIQATADAGHVLLISGDNLDITDTGLDISTAARQGTLVIGTVPVTSDRSISSAESRYQAGQGSRAS
jgi:hypothetical protein